MEAGEEVLGSISLASNLHRGNVPGPKRQGSESSRQVLFRDQPTTSCQAPRRAKGPNEGLLEHKGLEIIFP